MFYSSILVYKYQLGIILFQIDGQGVRAVVPFYVVCPKSTGDETFYILPILVWPVIFVCHLGEI